MNKDIKEEQNSLVCWIGDTDLLALGRFGLDTKTPQLYALAKSILELDKKGTAHNIESDIHTLDTNTRDSSIILTIENAGTNGIPIFSTIILLTNRPSNAPTLLKELHDSYPLFVKERCRSFNGVIKVAFVPNHPASRTGVNAWSYQDVYDQTKPILNDFFGNEIDKAKTWYIVTPGTIAQSTSLILLGKEFFHSANFIQVEKSRRRVEHCQIPFDVRRVIANQTSFIEDQISNNRSAIGRTPSFKRAIDRIKKIAQYPVTVLLTGESGTGKDVFAREIHRLSGRKGKFVAINCAMLSKETGVAELTGVFKGAYTDANETHGGKFHEARNGTLFLDEIGDCPLDVQAELLRFLQPLDSTRPSERRWHLKGSQPKDPSQKEREYCGEQRGDIRIIAATNKNLLDQTSFRQDLYFRIETIQINIPSLETRKAETDNRNGINDIKELADLFLHQSNQNFSQSKRFKQEAYDVLMAHTWTGNVRELQNLITRVVLLSDNDEITRDDIRSNLTQNATNEPISCNNDSWSTVAELARRDITKGGIAFSQREKEFQQAYCAAALQATGGNKKNAYTKLNLSANTFAKYLS